MSALFGCKKSEDTYAPVTVNVQIQSPLQLNLQIFNQVQSPLLLLSNISANSTYTTIGAKSGDKLTIQFNTNIINPAISNGQIYIDFIYRGNHFYSISGLYLEKDGGYTLTTIVP